MKLTFLSDEKDSLPTSSPAEDKPTPSPLKQKEDDDAMLEIHLDTEIAMAMDEEQDHNADKKLRKVLSLNESSSQSMSPASQLEPEERPR
jgi:hypothetical protein